MPPLTVSVSEKGICLISTCLILKKLCSLVGCAFLGVLWNQPYIFTVRWAAWEDWPTNVPNFFVKKLDWDISVELALTEGQGGKAQDTFWKGTADGRINFKLASTRPII